MAPRTVWGRLITIVYALAGIPLMLVYLSTVGDVLARSFRRLYGRVCRPRNCTRKQQPPPPPPPVGGIMGKAYRYDNHVETKAGNYYSASRESSCDDLGARGTSSAILLDCGSEGLLHATTSSTAALQVTRFLPSLFISSLVATFARIPECRTRENAGSNDRG